jgi:hypothetical protein
MGSEAVAMLLVSVVPKELEITVAFSHSDMCAIHKILGKSIIRYKDADVSEEDSGRFKTFMNLLEHCVNESEEGDSGT